MPTAAEIRAQQVSEHITQAARHLEEGNPSAALQAVHKALALRPGDAHCLRLVGEIYRKMGKEALAQRAFAAAEAQVKRVTPGGAPAAELAPWQKATAPVKPAEAPAAKAEPPAPKPRRDIYAHLRGGPSPQAEESHQEQAQVPSREPQAAKEAAVVATTADTQPVAPVVGAEQEQPITEPDAQPPEPSAAHLALPAFTQVLGPVPGALTSGPQVLNLQKLLNLEGLKVAESGQFDGATLVAVRALQRKYGFARPDGIVNGDTRRLLNRLTGNEAPLAGLKDRKPFPGLRLGDSAREAIDKLQGADPKDPAPG